MNGEVMEQVKYCGDCLYHRLKRGRNRQITGEHICVKWDMLKSEQTQVGSCPDFINRSSPEIHIEAPSQSLPPVEIDPHSYSTGCPHCGEEIGTSSEIEIGMMEGFDTMRTPKDGYVWKKVIAKEEN